MTELQKVYVELIAEGVVPSKESEEWKAWHAAQPYTPPGWAQRQLERIRRIAKMSDSSFRKLTA
jgi:hypothetical protein